jgi:UPF0755 protein
MKLRYVVLGTIIFFSVVLIGGFFYAKSLVAPVSSDATPQAFVIQQSETWNDIITNLAKKKLIRSELGFKILLKLSKANMVKAGEHQLKPSMSSQEILDILIQGKINEVWFRINEGFRASEIVDKIVTNKLFDKTAFEQALVPSLYDFDFLKNIPQNSLEGFLYPDTYLVPTDAKPQDFITQVLKNFGDKIQPYQSDIAANKLSLYQIIILASIVEKEASNQDDRDMIAGVYLKRLEIGMTLGSCPTILYALGSWDAPLTNENLAIDSPYNTRQNYGLPPGPICNPSVSSIKAVLHPTSTEYLYFLAKNGTTYYSKTYEEHLRKKAELGVE